MHGPGQSEQTQVSAPYWQYDPWGVHVAAALASASVPGHIPGGIGVQGATGVTIHWSVFPELTQRTCSLQALRGSLPYSQSMPSIGHRDPLGGAASGHVTPPPVPDDALPDEEVPEAALPLALPAVPPADEAPLAEPLTPALLPEDAPLAAPLPEEGVPEEPSPEEPSPEEPVAAETPLCPPPRAPVVLPPHESAAKATARVSATQPDPELMTAIMDHSDIAHHRLSNVCA